MKEMIEMSLGIRPVARAVALTVLAAPLALTPGAASAQRQASLEGAWSGGGAVILANGNSERARCRASFSRVTDKTFRMNAVCATSSARVSQSANVQRVSATQYAGRFYNPEYDVSGAISITVSGERLHASLRGGGAGANLSLRR